MCYCQYFNTPHERSTFLNFSLIYQVIVTFLEPMNEKTFLYHYLQKK